MGDHEASLPGKFEVAVWNPLQAMAMVEYPRWLPYHVTYYTISLMLVQDHDLSLPGKFEISAQSYLLAIAMVELPRGGQLNLTKKMKIA